MPMPDRFGSVYLGSMGAGFGAGCYRSAGGGTLVLIDTLYQPGGAPFLASVVSVYVPSGPMAPEAVHGELLALLTSGVNVTIPDVSGSPPHLTLPLTGRTLPTLESSLH